MGTFSVRIFIASLIVSLVHVVIAYGQQELNSASFTKEDLIQLADKKYGLDDLLVNGKRYQPVRINVNGTPDFEWDNSLGAKLFIKGQSFENIDLKYDIETDQLILINILEQGFERQIIMSTSLVDSFCLGNQLFINFAQLYPTSGEQGYYEKIFSGSSLLLKKHKKIYLRIYDSANKGRFSPQKAILFMYSEGRLINVNSKMAFLNFFDDNKKEIRQYIRRNGFNYKKASNDELYKLMTFSCHTNIK